MTAAMNRIAHEAAEKYGPKPTTPAEALVHVLAVYVDEPDGCLALTATNEIYGDGISTGLTMGDLRALQAELVRLRAANAGGHRVCPQCDEEQTTCTLCGASVEP